ncbi:MAG: hypothetical protein AUH88_04735 [Acidobacteria bacterium 13_1_40CM_4_61_5]|nr:MAG: hypothetical protein AUH88_04735 [Acidobacteria bacterium 13_1_40CM_4_61_5]
MKDSAQQTFGTKERFPDSAGRARTDTYRGTERARQRGNLDTKNGSGGKQQRTGSDILGAQSDARAFCWIMQLFGGIDACAGRRTLRGRKFGCAIDRGQRSQGR